MGRGREAGMLPDRAQTDDKTHRNRGVEDPAPIPVAKSSQQQKEEDEMEPGPHSTHPLEVSEEAVRGAGEKSAERDAAARNATRDQKIGSLRRSSVFRPKQSARTSAAAPTSTCLL